LSTPFVALKARSGAVKILLASFLVLWSAFYTLNYRWSLPFWLSGPLSGIIPGLLLGAKRVDYSLLERRIAEEQTASLPNGNYLFLRTSGDEAAAALSFAQISAWASSKLLAMFLLPIMRFVPEKDRRLFPFSLPRFLVMVIAVMAATYAAVNAVS